MTATLPPQIRFQPFAVDSVTGLLGPIPGGKVYFFQASTNMPQNVYADDGTTSIGNNLTLDANGATDFRLGTGLSYKIDLKDALGGAVAGWPRDLVTGIDGVLDSLANNSNTALGDALVGVKKTGGNAITEHDFHESRYFDAQLDFTIVANGIVDNTVAAQNAITTAGTSPLLWRRGTYLLDNLTFPDGINWIAEPGAVFLAKSSVTAMSWITALGAQQSGSIDGLTFDLNHNANMPHILRLGENARNWDIKNCTFLRMFDRNAIRVDYTAHVAGDGNLKFRNLTFANSTGNGNPLEAAGAFAIYATPGVGTTDILIENCRATDVGGVVLALECNGNDMIVAGVPTYGTYKRVTVDNFTIVGNGGGPNGTIPTEFQSIDWLNVSNCIVDTATRGIGFMGCRYGQSSGNVISNQSLYAHEVSLLDTFVFSDESIYNCATYIKDTFSITGYAACRNVTIEGNEINGSGLSVYAANINCISFKTLAGGALKPKNIKVRGNSFINSQYWDSILRLGYVDGLEVADNSYTIQNLLDAWVFATIDNHTNAVYSDNTIKMTADFAATNPAWGGIPFVFSIGAANSNILLENNRLIDSVASPTIGDNFGCFGLFTGSQALQNVVVRKNYIQGFWGEFTRMGDTTNTAMVIDNDTSKAVFKGAGTLPLYTRVRATYDSIGVPTTGTYRIGDRIVERVLTVGQPKAWSCTVAGTKGAYAEGRTATTNGTPNVVLSASSAVLQVGMFLTINGIGGQVLSLNGTAMVMDTNVTAGGPGLAIAFTAGTLVSEGNL